MEAGEPRFGATRGMGPAASTANGGCGGGRAAVREQRVIGVCFVWRGQWGAPGESACVGHLGEGPRLPMPYKVPAGWGTGERGDKKKDFTVDTDAMVGDRLRAGSTPRLVRASTGYEPSSRWI